MIKIIENAEQRKFPQSKSGLSPQRLVEIKLKISRQHYFSKEVLQKVAEKILDEL
jgi:hypothetical protein